MGLLKKLGLTPTPAMLGRAAAAAKPETPPAQASDAPTLKEQAAKLLRQRLGNLKSNIDKAVALAGAGGEAVKKRLSEAEQALEQAVKSGVKEAVDKAQRAIDVVQMVVDDALSDADTQAQLRQQTDQLQAQIQRLRDDAGAQMDQVDSAAGRAQLLALLKALDSELLTTLRIADLRKRLQGLEALRTKAEKAGQFAAKLAGAKANPKAKGDGKPEQSPQMKALVVRFQETMTRIKSLQADKSPDAARLKAAAIAAGNLSTSTKGIVQANTALDQVDAQVEDARLKLDAVAGKAGAASDGRRPDAQQLATEARKRLKSQQERGRKALAADPLNPNADWLTEVVASLHTDIDELEKLGTERELKRVNEQLDWLEKSIVKFETGAKRAAQDSAQGGASPDKPVPDAKQQVADARKRLKSQAERGRKAIAADPRNTNADWLTDVLASSEERIADLEKSGTQRDLDSVTDRLDWLEDSIASFEEGAKRAAQDSPKAGASSDKPVPDAKQRAAAARKRLKSQDERGRKALAADPRNTNAGWLTDAVARLQSDIDDLEKLATERELERVDKGLDWLEGSIVSFEEGAQREAQNAKSETGAEVKPQPAQESPEVKKVKAHFKRVMAEVKKLADAKNPEAAKLKQAAVDAGNLATSPKGIRQANQALEQVHQDVAKATAAAAKAQADADQAATQTFNITVGARKLVGVHRDEAMQALRFEIGVVQRQLEAGWAYHVDQMNLPSEVPFQAWLTTGVDAVKSFFKGRDAAKIPDLNIWDPARDMMIEVRKAERQGDVAAMAALLPKLGKLVEKARAKVGKYQDQMEDSAQTGVDAGRFVEDTAASALGALAEKEGGKPAKVAVQAAAQGVFQGVEQLTEWLIGSRQQADPGAIARKAGEEAIGAIFKELVGGALKGPFKSAFGSYIGKGVDDAALKAMGLSRDAFMTATQKYLAEFAAKQGAGLIKSAIAKLINGKLPGSPGELADAVAAELTKGAGKQLIVDGIKQLI